MAQQIGNYTVYTKAQVNTATGAVVLVTQVIETSTGKVVIDDLPANLVNTVKNNLQAVAGQYDVIGV